MQSTARVKSHRRGYTAQGRWKALEHTVRQRGRDREHLEVLLEKIRRPPCLESILLPGRALRKLHPLLEVLPSPSGNQRLGRARQLEGLG